MIFDLAKIHKAFPITGVMHVGAFAGEELGQYRSLGLTNTIMFEPQKDLYDRLCPKMILDEKIYNVALGSSCGTMDMYISHREGGIEMGSGASSSLLKPKVHLEEHPEVTFPETQEVEVRTLDEYHEEGYNFLNIDVQGYELEVLKGGVKTLNSIDAMIVEVNRDEVYEGCPRLEDISEFLSPFGFTIVDVAWQSKSWGDAIYAKI
tara:strand:- start:2212 stop:2829 length:618 start_codon:yes stop_codon:yes gene_type:complete